VVTNALGQVVLMNPAFRHQLGLAEDAAPGQPIEAYIPDEGFAQLVRESSGGRHCSSGSAPTYEFALSGDRYLQARGRSVISGDNECLGAVVTVVDITTMKILDRLKSEFVATVSHELRSPLSTIHEQIALVLRDMVQGDSEREQYLLARAKEKTQGLISLIGDLLDLSRIESGSVCQELKPVQLEDLLRSIVDFLSTRSRSRGQELTLEVPPTPLPPLTADPLALESIFGNLITNAINYTPDGGEIRVVAEVAGERVQVRVSDTGFGIEADKLDRIFERFYRVKNEKTRFITGTGLGLSIVKGLVQTLGGTITVASEPGKGSTFTVTLPC
jgi:signal transduction histidine kinase